VEPGPGEGGDVSDGGFFVRVFEWFTDPEQWSGSSGIPVRLVEHLQISGIPIAVAALVALPAAMYIGHRRRLEFLVVSVANLGRAIPSFGLLFLFVILLGIGGEAVLIAMTLLAIPPILTNTYVGIQAVDPDTLEAARGMGMSELRVLTRIEVPLAGPVIVAGLRTAAVQVVATATLAAVVAGGGLGRFIQDGFASGDRPQVFGGAVLVALLAIVVDLGFGLFQRAVVPRTSSGERPSAEPALLPPVPGPAA
jgi:osmoprotectant transport system permease protein